MTKNARFTEANLSEKALGVLSAYNGTHVSKLGYEFDLLSDKWEISGGVIINFELLDDVDQEFEIGLRAALSRYAEEYSAFHTVNMYKATKTYLVNINAKFISVEGIAKYKAGLDDCNEYKLGAIKGFWLAWYDWGLPGIDDDAATFLDELTLAGNEKGAAVKKGCPYTGPLTELEQAALLEWSTNALLDKTIELAVYAYFLTLSLTGRRSIQIRSLRSCDLSDSESDQGYNYELKIPRAKQRGYSFRELLKPLPITEELYLTLKCLIDENVLNIEKSFSIKLSNTQKVNLPVFIEWDRIVRCGNFQQFEATQKKQADYFHITSYSADVLLRTFAHLSQAKSERTGDYINLHSRRFRYTKGSNLARLGIDGVTLAEALDHSDTQHIGVYTENVPRNAEIINEIMSARLAPLAQAFAGTLIESERDALRAGDPNSRVKNDRAHNIGNCGKHGFCASGYRGCYTCKMFQPWLDAPHVEVLEDLLAERQYQLNEGVPPQVVQATDRLLLAIQQVIQMCEIAKMEQGAVNG